MRAQVINKQMAKECGTYLVPRIRALIIDDEPIARQVLREELQVIDSVEVVGEAETGEEAISKISSAEPDVVLLDIQMPGMGGFGLLDDLNSGHLPVIIMVTAYNQHAIQAFEAGAVDYLLKPVSQSRLLQAIDRARRILSNPREACEKLAHLQDVAPLAGTT